MDLEGQNLCERVFLGLMWTVTLLAALLTFILDNVLVMFVTFASGMAVGAIVSNAYFQYAIQVEQLLKPTTYMIHIALRTTGLPSRLGLLQSESITIH